MVASIMPQSHELRYYLFWALLLISVNLVLWADRARTLTAIVPLCAFGLVAWSTGGVYLYPSGESFTRLLSSEVDPRVVEGASPGATICVARPPWTFLYAGTFHGKSYHVQEALSPQDCRR
jgi:hypothetical protein